MDDFDFDKLFEIYDRLNNGHIKNKHRAYNVAKANSIAIPESSFYKIIDSLNILTLLDKEQVAQDVIMQVAVIMNIDNIYKLYKERKGKGDK